MQTTLPGRWFGGQLDLARQIERPDVLRRGVEALAAAGHNLCMLYLEDAYQYPRHPKIGRTHAYDADFMAEIHERCAGHGMELVPVIPALGHAAYITRKPGYADYDEGRGTDRNHGCLSPSFPETYDLIRDLFADWAEHIPGQFIHGGMDESPGMGQYLIRTEGIDAFDRTTMFADHANRVAAIAREFDRRLCIWGDMLYYIPDAVERLDKDIIVVDWYYYPFPETPRVELFNFGDIDLSGQCKGAGLEVWGAPAVWPNLPWPDLADRWDNLESWIRYGNRVGVDGLVNCEWENSRGLPEMTHFTFRVLGEHLRAADDASLVGSVATVLRRDYEIAATDPLAADLASLGAYQLTGNPHRRDLTADPVIFASPLEQDQWKQNYAGINSLCRALPEPYGQAAERLLETVKTAHGMMRLYWQLRASLPNCYEALADPTGELGGSMVADVFAEIRDRAATLADRYECAWNRVRYPDENRSVLDWLQGLVATMDEWQAALDTDTEHPLTAAPRLDLALTCRHPALPCARIDIDWGDDDRQAAGTTLIPFHGRYAVPDIQWRHPAVFRLDRDEWPRTIRIVAFHYGQIGIDEVSVWRHGSQRRYRLTGLTGDHALEQDGVAWIGPIGGTPDSPLHPVHEDVATYEPA